MFCSSCGARLPNRTTIAAALACHLTCILLLAGSVYALDPNKRPKPSNGQSNPSQYVATVWQTEQGLPVNTVQEIVQDSEGYLWLATDAGLARFDGVRFRVFGGEDFPSLQSSRFQSLYAGHSGELWFGTRNGGLIRLHDGMVTTYLERDGLPSTNIVSIRGDAGGKLWVNTIHGVVCCAGGRLQAYHGLPGKSGQRVLLAGAGRKHVVPLRNRRRTFRGRWLHCDPRWRFYGPRSSRRKRVGWFSTPVSPGALSRGAFSDLPPPATAVRQWTGADRGRAWSMSGGSPASRCWPWRQTRMASC